MSLDLGVKVQWSKSATPDLRRKLRSSMIIAEQAAKHIRSRCLAGRYATKPEPYDAEPPRTKRGRVRKRSYLINSDYGQLAGTDKVEFYSSADFHRVVGAVPGHVTGKMWEGMRVRNYGSEGAIIDFGGSSLGQKSSRRVRRRRVAPELLAGKSKSEQARLRQRAEPLRDKRGEVKFAGKPRKVRNQYKAAAVFKHSRIGLLQTTSGEVRAMAWGWADAANYEVSVLFGMAQTVDLSPTGANFALYEAIRRGIKRGL